MGKSLLFLVGGLTIITGLVNVQNSDRMQDLPEITNAYYEEQVARNVAKSLIDNAIENMKADNNWTDSLTLTEVMDAGSMITRSNNKLKEKVKKLQLGQTVESTQTQELEADVLNAMLDQDNLSGSLKSYTQSSTNKPANSVGSWDEYKVLLMSTSTYDNIEVTTEVLMQRDSFSKYSYMTNSELSSSGSNIWFMGADNIYGPIHTNGTFRMSGSPSFYGLITSPNNWVAHSTNPTSPNFFGGENFNAPTKDSPNSYELGKLATAAAVDGLTFDANIDINFYENGGSGYATITKSSTTSYTCGTSLVIPSLCSGSSSWTSYDLDLSQIGGIISTSGRIDVDGVVKGAVTLHAGTLIEIDGDISYFTSPLVDSSSTDLLGLVSEGDVRIDANAHSASGTQDVTVHASIMALNTSFYVENYWSGSGRGTLNLLGGIIQKNRGAVGTFSGGSIVSGYQKNYQYDGRLRGSIPPAFPRESVFSIVYWKEEITDLSQ